MKKRELESLLMQHMQLPRKTIQKLFAALGASVSYYIRRGERATWAPIGTFETKLMRATRRKNLHGPGIIAYPAQRGVKMTRYGLPTQLLTPYWSPDYTYQDERTYPTSRLTVRMMLTQAATLSQCNHFLYTLAEIILEQVVLGNKITIRYLGNFRPVEWKERKYKNPHTGVIADAAARVQMAFRPSPLLIGAVR